jgi:hypothetical protein
MWRILKIGIPGVVMMAQKNLSNLIVMKLSSITDPGCCCSYCAPEGGDGIFYGRGWHGLSSRCACGPEPGANEPERAGKSGIYAIMIAESFVITACALAFIFPEAVILHIHKGSGTHQGYTLFLRIGVVG